MRTISACPACHQAKLSPYIITKDHSVSHETFRLQQCQSCGFVMTNPQPTKEELPRYYQSDTYISHSNQARSIVDRFYKIARTYTLQWKFQLIKRYSLDNPRSVLDFGCGTGAFLRTCQVNGLTIAGVEPSATARAEASRITKTDVAAELQQVHGQFDAITLWHVLEHVADLHDTITMLRDRLANNGTMFIAVPNLQSADAKIYGETWAAYDVPRHLWHFSRKTMALILHQHNLKVVKELPMPLDAFYVSMLSEKYIRGKNSPGGMINAIVRGFKSNSSARTSSEFSSIIYIVRK